MKIIVPNGFSRLFLGLLLCTVANTVSATIRYVKPGGTSLTGLSWAAPAGDLQLMINNSFSGDEIWVVQGTYSPNRRANATGTITLNNRGNAFVLKTGVSIYGGFVGTELARNLRNYTTHVTILSGDIGAVLTTTDNCYHVVVAAGANGNGTLDGFTVLNGYADLNPGSITVNTQVISSFSGGGIYIAGASPVIRNCIIRRNNALNGTNIGGAGINISATSAPLISSCTFNSNTTTGTTAHGAAMYIASSSATLSSCTFSNNTSSAEAGAIYLATTAVPAITNCTFTGNTAVKNGGAVSNHATAALSMSGCHFTTNTAQLNGGGIYNAAASLTLSTCDFSGNIVTNTMSVASNGAGIYNTASTSVISDCNFSQNEAADEGGGIYNASCTITITNSSFSENSAGQGGAGISNLGTAGSITSCDFTSNSTSGLGGGMHNVSSSPATSNCLFSGNSATLGGGMHNATNSSPSITSCRFLGNTSTDQGAGIRDVTNSSPKVTNCIFTGNKADNQGGGAANQDASNPVFTNCTFSGNLSVAGMGSAMYNSVNATVTIKNCILWHDFNTEISNNASTATVTKSIVEGTYPGGINEDPLFVNPVSPTLAPSTAGDYHVQKCSPAINAGSNAAIPAGITTDLDNNSRIIFATVDMGAYEKQVVFAVPDAAGIIYVDATKNGDGSSWANAAPELADALMAAKYNTAVAQIWVAKGIYHPIYDATDGATLACTNVNRNNAFVMVNNVKIYGGFAGGEISLTERNTGTNQTVLSGDIGTANNLADNCYHVVICTAAVGTAALDGFSLLSGNAGAAGSINVNGIDVAQSNGAALYIDNSSPSILNCKLSGNICAGIGGAVLCVTSNAKITNCLINGNKSGNDGGGMALLDGTVQITNCTISGNKASQGGGISYENPSHKIRNTIIWGNVASVAGNALSGAGTAAVTFSNIEGGYAGTGNTSTDPLFVNPQPASAAPTVAGDYHLQKCSPCLNAGSNALIPAGVITDIDNSARINYGVVDIGCYEKQLVSAVQDATGIIYVDQTKNGDGSSWANATPELADALLAARFNTAVTQIWVAKGTYFPRYNAIDETSLACNNAGRDNAFVLVNNVKLYGGFAGGENNLSARDFENNITILSGDIGAANDTADNCNHVLVSAGPVGTAEIDGFTITEGNATAPVSVLVNAMAVEKYRGGGIALSQSSPVINHCKIIHNFGGNGAGISIISSSPVIQNSIISGNVAINDSYGLGYAGGIDNFATSTIILSLPVIINCQITGNSGGHGGGFVNTYPSVLTIINSTIAGNYALKIGGGIASALTASETIKNCIIWGNRAGQSGNNIFTSSGNELIANSLVEGNYPGTLNIDADPLFVLAQPATAAPTTLGDYKLQRCSPAINAGNNASIPAGIITDLMGNPRIALATVDMGAYEKQYASPDASGIVYVDAARNGDGKTWANALTELADALKAAKSNPSITQVWVAKGTYYPLYDAATVGCAPTDNRDRSFVLVNNVKIYGGFAAGESSIAGRDFIANLTTLSGDIGAANDNADNCYHVLISAAAVGTALLDGFTVAKGNANGTGDIDVNANVSDRVRGAGISNLSSSPGISNCIFSNNTAGAGAALANLIASPVINNCSFISNTATNSGGAIDNYFGSSGTISNCIFSLNRADNGGAITNSGGSSLSISNTTLSGNTATGVGGGIYNVSSPLTITDCSFSGNIAAGGGGMYNSLSSPDIQRCLFSGNTTSSSGGGMYNSSSSPSITNCTFLGNLASLNGGGIRNAASSFPIILNCTIAGNKAVSSGGGIHSDASVPVIKNSIVYGNIAASENAVFPASGSTAINSLIEAGYATGTNIINADPLFVSPQPASAAPTSSGDYHLQPCSPAINLGDNNSVPGTVATDLDGNVRIKFTDVDMGAYEVQTQDATQSTWRGINTNWNDKVNWCGGFIPTATTSVIIPAGLANYPATAAANAVKDISLQNSTSVTVSNTGTLAINGTYTNSGGSITNNGSWIMTGSSAGQSFPGTSGTISAMNNLEISNPSGITFNKSFSIKGTLTATAGNINLNNADITLLSDANGTASIAPVQPSASFSYTGTGAFIVERFINTGNNTAIGQHTKSWQFLATPTTGQTIFQSWQEGGTAPAGFGTLITGTGIGFDITTVLPSIKFYRDDINNWAAVTNTSSALQNKLGYMLFVRGDRTVTTSAGMPNNTNMRSRGFIFTPANPPPSVPVQAGKFQSFGNPYASRIAFSKLRTSSTGINDVFYVWDPKLTGNAQVGGYQTLNGITGYTPTAGGPGTNYPAGVPSPYIESGQAVFVRGDGTGGNVNFNENIKETGNRLVNRNDNADIANRQFLFASLFTNTGMIADGNIIAFEQGFGSALNELDAYKLMNDGENFGISRNGQILAVEAREPVTVTDTLFYNIQNLRQQAYQLRFAPVHMEAVSLPAFLIDRYSNSIISISLHDSSFVDFSVTADAASSAAGRFIMVFNLQGAVPLTFTSVKAYRYESDINVEWHVENEIGTLLYEVEKSMTGNDFRKIATIPIENNNSSGNTYISPDKNPVIGSNFYRIKSTGPGNEVQYSNIVKVMIEAKAGISVYPNPVVEGNLQLLFTNMPGGIYMIRLFSNNGQLVFEKQFLHTAGNNYETIKTQLRSAHENYTLEITGPENCKFTKLVLLK